MVYSLIDTPLNESITNIDKKEGYVESFYDVYARNLKNKIDFENQKDFVNLYVEPSRLVDLNKNFGKMANISLLADVVENTHQWNFSNLEIEEIKYEVKRNLDESMLKAC